MHNPELDSYLGFRTPVNTNFLNYFNKNKLGY